MFFPREFLQKIQYLHLLEMHEARWGWELAGSGLFDTLNSPFFREEGVIWLLAFCSVSKSEDFRKNCTISCAAEKATVFLTV